MDIANNSMEGDTTLEKDGLKVFLEQNANRMLSEATIDFSDEQGFLISGTQSGTQRDSCGESCCR
ncbi:MAG: hypothetical protein HY805_00145 [Nitrospirae bacterium]|nr:hypothetical protein [Nitrospirota bacterium]